jgi:phage terminase Nu1 subunit (DNA packaging protein)
VADAAHRLNVTLDSEHAARPARNVASLLDGIPGAYERAHKGLERAHDGETIALNEL